MVDITIGQYYPEDSVIHKLDPRVKLFGTLVFVVMVFMINNVIGYGLITLFLGIVIKMSKVPFKKMMKGIRGIIFIMLLSVVFNIFLTPGDVIVHFLIFTITKQGIIKGVYMAIRLVLLVVGTSVMTLTTTPNDLADGLEKSFGILNVIKFPVHEIAMVMSLALRFIPTLMEETDKITKAQKARGASFDTGNILQRAKSLIPILMEARCYHGGERTKMKPLSYNRHDAYAYVVCFLIIAIILGTNFMVNNITTINMLILVE